MSAPCPPAFMRTAPPIEPGTPTAHSKPVSPAAALSAGDDREAGRAAGPNRRAVDLHDGEALTEQDHDPVEPVVGDEQIGAPADDQHGHVGPPSAPRPELEVARGRRPGRAPPPDRRLGRSSSGPIGACDLGAGRRVGR